MKLPDGWKAEPQERSERVVLTMPDRHGFITIDFALRRFAPGHRSAITLMEHKGSPYIKGREWRQRLVDEAVAWASKTFGLPMPKQIYKRSGFKDYNETFWVNTSGKFGCRYQCKHCGKVALGLGDDDHMHWNKCPKHPEKKA